MSKVNKFTLILGMHRSGTSCLAGALEKCGLYLGAVRRKGGKSNKKGFYELKKLQIIHDQILALNQSSWLEPPQQPIIIHPYHIKLLEEIVEELRPSAVSGIKDPRNLLMLSHWQKILSPNYQMVGTFRHPLAVAKSLAFRNGLSIKHGLRLWKSYNYILIEAHKKAPFPLIHFDLESKKSYLKSLKKITKELGLKYSTLRLTLFISKKLEHHQYNIEQVPSEYQEAYQYLLKNKI